MTKEFEKFENEDWNYLFVMFEGKKTEKYKSRDLIAIAKYLEWNKSDILYYSLSNKTVDASQYEEME